MSEYVVITLVPAENGWVAFCGTKRSVPGRRYPVTLRKPWEHVIQVSPLLDVTHVCLAIEDTLRRLAAEPQ